MFFMVFIALSLCLLTLIAGTVLYVWGLRTPGKGSAVARVIGLIIMVMMIITSFCAYVQGMRFQHQVYMMQQMMDGNFQPMVKIRGMHK